ncbi:MAG: hypothetical protein IKY33_01760 [Clostridia bacterium]|nr:hypothetical protein [Clostridia bacterium]
MFDILRTQNEKKCIIAASVLLYWIVHLLLYVDFVIIDNLECNYLYFAVGDSLLFVCSIILTILIPSAFSEAYHIRLEAVFKNKQEYFSEIEKLKRQAFDSYTNNVFYNCSADEKMYMIYESDDLEQTICYTLSFGCGDFWLKNSAEHE